MNEINIETAKRLLTIVDAGLSKGLGNPVPGEMCIEAAVCAALNLPHGDNPPCVDDVVRSFKIRLNDANWSSKEARAKGMRAIAVAQLGSAGVIDSKLFNLYVIEQTIKQIIPMALDNVIKRCKSKIIKNDILNARNLCIQKGNRESALIANAAAAAYAADAVDAAAAADAAYAAAYAAYAADAVDAAAAAVDAAAAAADAVDAAAATAYAAYAAYAAAAADAVDAAAAAAYAAYAAAYAADAAAYAADAVDAAAADNILCVSANICFEALKICNSPGVLLWNQINSSQ